MSFMSKMKPWTGGLYRGAHYPSFWPLRRLVWRIDAALGAWLCQGVFGHDDHSTHDLPTLVEWVRWPFRKYPDVRAGQSVPCPHCGAELAVENDSGDLLVACRGPEAHEVSYYRAADRGDLWTRALLSAGYVEVCPRWWEQFTRKDI